MEPQVEPISAYNEPRKSRTGLIVIIVILVFLCCCCGGMLVFYFWLGDLIIDFLRSIFGYDWNLSARALIAVGSAAGIF